MKKEVSLPHPVLDNVNNAPEDDDLYAQDIYIRLLKNLLCCSQ
jgi:hypothetical protein